MKNITLLIIFFLFIIHAFAQQKQQNKIHFTSINNVGLLFGEKGNNVNVQTINGIRTQKQFVVALGVGYDNYITHSIPVFLDVRKYWGNKKIQPFLFGDIGKTYNLNDATFPKNYFNGTKAYDFTSSAYYEMGAGISKKISAKLKLNLSAGYSFKECNYNSEQYPYSSIFAPAFYPTNVDFKFSFQRLSIKMGLVF